MSFEKHIANKIFKLMKYRDKELELLKKFKGEYTVQECYSCNSQFLDELEYNRFQNKKSGCKNSKYSKYVTYWFLVKLLKLYY